MTLSRLGNASVLAGVAQISNLLYRRVVVGRALDKPTRSGLQIRDTAECNSALRVGRPSPAKTEALPGSKFSVWKS